MANEVGRWIGPGSGPTSPPSYAGLRWSLAVLRHVDYVRASARSCLLILHLAFAVLCFVFLTRRRRVCVVLALTRAHEKVDLALHMYRLPRLTKMWTHLERQQGGVGLRGPGERQLEVDRSDHHCFASIPAAVRSNVAI